MIKLFISLSLSILIFYSPAQAEEYSSYLANDYKETLKTFITTNEDIGRLHVTRDNLLQQLRILEREEQSLTMEAKTLADKLSTQYVVSPTTKDSKLKSIQKLGKTAYSRGQLTEGTEASLSCDNAGGCRLTYKLEDKILSLEQSLMDIEIEYLKKLKLKYLERF